MITAVRIESLRGIGSGAVDGLARIAVLVGANGCGKSTVLDALHIGASRTPGDAVGRAVKRRTELRNGARWLFSRGGRGGQVTAKIVVNLDDTESSTELRLMPQAQARQAAQLAESGHSGPFSGIWTAGKRGNGSVSLVTAFAGDNGYLVDGTPWAAGPRVELIEPGMGAAHRPLAGAYSEAVEDGRLRDVTALASDVVPGLTQILILTDESGSSVVHLVFDDHSIPAAIAGDGVVALLRTAFELALPAGSTALLEEPEAHQHARSLRQSALAIVAAARRGIQVVLSTHSLELIDDLIAELGDTDLGLLSLHHLAKVGPELRAVTYTGAEAAFARSSIGEDLR